MNDLEPMHSPEQEIVEQKVRRAVGINALRKIGVIVAREENADAKQARSLRWMLRYGWLVLLAGAALLAYSYGIF